MFFAIYAKNTRQLTGPKSQSVSGHVLSFKKRKMRRGKRGRGEGAGLWGDGGKIHR